MVEVAEEALVAQLSEYLKRANQGEIIIVLRDGEPVAHIVPAEISSRRARAAAAMRSMRNAARTKPSPPITTDEILEWIHEGRR